MLALLNTAGEWQAKAELLLRGQMQMLGGAAALLREAAMLEVAPPEEAALRRALEVCI